MLYIYIWGIIFTQNIKNFKENTVIVLKGPSLPFAWQAIPVPYRTELLNWFSIE